LVSLSCVHGQAGTPEELFKTGVEAYRGEKYIAAAENFHLAAAIQPSSGTLQNAGNAEWKCGRTGLAILAWEQAVWVDPFNAGARMNLQFARKSAQLEGPDLPWYEVISGWLPANWWAWIAGISLWTSIGLITLPTAFRWRKATWQQALAALAIMVFLLAIPAHVGVTTRAHLGFVLSRNTELRLTATEEGQVVARLAEGEPGRFERVRGHFVLVQTQRGRGWIERERFGFICPPKS
jgi:hypothetical protein